MFTLAKLLLSFQTKNIGSQLASYLSAFWFCVVSIIILLVSIEYYYYSYFYFTFLAVVLPSQGQEVGVRKCNSALCFLQPVPKQPCLQVQIIFSLFQSYGLLQCNLKVYMARVTFLLLFTLLPLKKQGSKKHQHFQAPLSIMMSSQLASSLARILV